MPHETRTNYLHSAYAMDSKDAWLQLFLFTTWALETYLYFMLETSENELQSLNPGLSIFHISRMTSHVNIAAVNFVNLPLRDNLALCLFLQLSKTTFKCPLPEAALYVLADSRNILTSVACKPFCIYSVGYGTDLYPLSPKYEHL